MFLQDRNCALSLYLKEGLKSNMMSFQMSSFMPSSNFKIIKERTKIKGLKWRFHNLAKIEGSMKYQIM